MRAHKVRAARVVNATVDACARWRQGIFLGRHEVEIVTLARADNPRPDIPPQQRAVIGRLAGDRFGILLADTGLAQATNLLQTVRESLSRPVLCGDRAVPIGASIGLTSRGEGQLGTTDALISEAEAALLGVFQVSVLHNVVHLLFGVAGLLMSRTRESARLYLVGGGAIYLLLWIYGLLIDHDGPANFVPVNEADNWLHLVLGLGMVALGLLLSRDRTPRPVVQR